MNKNFNIQLFAENLNTTATMSKEMKTFYEKRLIDQAEPSGTATSRSIFIFARLIRRKLSRASK